MGVDVLRTEGIVKKKGGVHALSVLNTLAKPNMFKSVGSHLAEQMWALNLLFSENNSFPGNHKLFPNPRRGGSPEGAAIPLLWILVGLAIDCNPGRGDGGPKIHEA